jgi:hypothetical protein
MRKSLLNLELQGLRNHANPKPGRNLATAILGDAPSLFHRLSSPEFQKE